MLVIVVREKAVLVEEGSGSWRRERCVGGGGDVVGGGN